MANRLTTGFVPEKDSLYEKLIKEQLIKKVEEKLHASIKDDIDKTIKDLAIEAVSTWAVEMKAMNEHDAMNPFSSGTKIQIDFVENIIRTIEKENDISITVNK